MKFKIKRRKYNVKGSLAWEYNPLHNLVRNKESKILEDFDTDKLTDENDGSLDYAYHSTVKKVTNDYENWLSRFLGGCARTRRIK